MTRVIRGFKTHKYVTPSGKNVEMNVPTSEWKAYKYRYKARLAETPYHKWEAVPPHEYFNLVNEGKVRDGKPYRKARTTVYRKPYNLVNLDAPKGHQFPKNWYWKGTSRKLRRARLYGVGNVEVARFDV